MKKGLYLPEYNTQNLIIDIASSGQEKMSVISLIWSIKELKSRTGKAPTGRNAPAHLSVWEGIGGDGV